MVFFSYDLESKTVKISSSPSKKSTVLPFSRELWREAHILILQKVCIDKLFDVLNKTNLKNINSILINYCTLTKVQMVFFAKILSAINIYKLILNENDWEDQAFQIFTKFNWKYLRVLHICELLTYKKAKFIAEGNWPNIIDLEIDSNIDESGADVLLETNWHRLQRVNFYQNNLSDCGLKKLVNSSWSELNSLYFMKNNLTYKSMKFIVQAKFIKIENLGIEDNFIGNQGLKVLTKADFPNLRVLEISGNDIEIEGLQMLKKGNWKKLESLRMGQSEVFIETAKSLIGCDWQNFNQICIVNNEVQIDQQNLFFFHQTVNSIIKSTYLKIEQVDYQ